MIYLTGATNDQNEPGLISAGVGLMAQPGNSYHLRVGRYRCWGADNGCFADRWDEDRWIRWLENLVGELEHCLFATAPDVYPDAAATVERSRPWLPILREMGYPVALVAQDGAERLVLPWEDFDCLFIGGEMNRAHPDREWKVSNEAAQLVEEARRRGKWVHMGRVNSAKRLARARVMGCHSADGTFIKHIRRKRATDLGDNERQRRGEYDMVRFLQSTQSQRLLFQNLESPSHPVHRRVLQ